MKRKIIMLLFLIVLLSFFTSANLSIEGDFYFNNSISSQEFFVTNENSTHPTEITFSLLNISGMIFRIIDDSTSSTVTAPVFINSSSTKKFILYQYPGLDFSYFELNKKYYGILHIVNNYTRPIHKKINVTIENIQIEEKENYSLLEKEILELKNITQDLYIKLGLLNNYGDDIYLNHTKGIKLNGNSLRKDILKTNYNEEEQDIVSLYPAGSSGWEGVEFKISSMKRFLFKNGNVGIGIDKPTEKLEVAGNIKAEGTVCDKNGCIGDTSNQSNSEVTSGSWCGLCGDNEINVEQCDGYNVCEKCPEGYTKKSFSHLLYIDSKSSFIEVTATPKLDYVCIRN
jgi:hypothetical protein